MRPRRRDLARDISLTASVFIPLIIITVIYAFAGIAPFGDKTMLVADANGQYDSFWLYYRGLFSGESDLYYSFGKTVGGGMSGLFAYYLASPFNAIFALFPAEKLPLALHLTIRLKLSLCGLTFAVFWDKTRGTTWKTPMLSTAYALCAYCVGFSWCVMWLDGVMLLPLIALGLHKLTKGEKPWLYIISLGAAIFSSYYIGFMLCIFSLFYYIYLTALNNTSLKSVDFKNVRTFALSSICAGGLSAAVLLPGILSMQGGKRVPMGEVLTEYISRYAYPLFDRVFPERAAEYESMAKALLIIGAAAVVILLTVLVFIFCSKRVPQKLKIAAGAVCAAGFVGYNLIRENYVLLKLLTATTTADEMAFGKPNIFAGITVLIMAVAYFAGKTVGRREKLISLAFTAVMLFSFSSLSINMIWHGFTENHSFNYRYSFIFVFFMLILAGEALEKIGQESRNGIIAGGCAAAALAAAGIILRPDFINVGTAVSDIVLAAVICAAVFLMNGAKSKRMAYAAAALLVAAHMGNIMFSAGSTVVSMTDSYQSTVQEFADRTARFEEIDARFDCGEELCRVRKDYIEKGANDALASGYNGVGSFSSAEKTAVVELLDGLGVQTYQNIWANGEYGMTRAADSLLGVRSVMSNSGYLDYVPVSGSDLYENPYALPMAFFTDADVTAVVSPADCPFEYTNSLFASLVSESDLNIFTPAQISGVELNGLYCILSGSDCDSVYGAQEAGVTGTLDYTVDITSADPLYLYMTAEEYQNADVYINGEHLCSYFDPYSWRTVLLGQFSPGEQVTVSVSANAGVLSVGEVYLYYESSEALSRYHGLLTRQSCSAKSTTDSQISSEIVSDRSGYVVYTIPADAGWKVRIDGRKAESCQALGMFIAVLVEAGEHTVELSYRPQGMILGIVISLCAATAAAAWFAADRKLKLFG